MDANGRKIPSQPDRTVNSGENGCCARLHRDEQGATTLEWVLLLAAIGLPSYYIFQLALATLVGHYQLVTTINALPFP